MHIAQVSLNKYTNFIAGKFAYFFRRQKMANARYTEILQYISFCGNFRHCCTSTQCCCGYCAVTGSMVQRFVCSMYSRTMPSSDYSNLFDKDYTLPLQSMVFRTLPRGCTHTWWHMHSAAQSSGDQSAVSTCLKSVTTVTRVYRTVLASMVVLVVSKVNVFSWWWL